MMQKNDRKNRGLQDPGPTQLQIVTLAEPVREILQVLDPDSKVSHVEARAMLARIKDNVLEETGLTRAQLDYEIYLRSLQS